MSRQARSRRRPRPGGDGGFTLLEAVMSMAVVAVLASVALAAIMGTTRATGSNIRRTAATNLAMRQIESVRSLPAESIP
jgi:prepilin-type N-terminal cleavage/methylation domain-containing protein